MRVKMNCASVLCHVIGKDEEALMSILVASQKKVLKLFCALEIHR